MSRYHLTREVLMSECPWLNEDVPAGTEVDEHTGPTYGVVSPDGIACRLPGQEAFVEIPRDALAPIREGYEMFEGRMRKVVDASRSGWWRFNEDYDRNGYCDNPARGY